jgi:hypothetical protein
LGTGVENATIIIHESTYKILSKPEDDGHATLYFVIVYFTVLSAASDVRVVSEDELHMDTQHSGGRLTGGTIVKFAWSY